MCLYFLTSFTDQALFPENPIGNRMMIKELPEDTLRELGDKYKNEIDVKIGLEIEYIPSFLRTKYSVIVFVCINVTVARYE